MTLSDLAARLELKVFTPGIPLDRPVLGGYASDLLSDVIGHGRKDDVWVTMQVHPNIVAVAVLKDLAGIVLVNGREPAAGDAGAGGAGEGAPSSATGPATFELAGRLYGLGVKGS